MEWQRLTYQTLTGTLGLSRGQAKAILDEVVDSGNVMVGIHVFKKHLGLAEPVKLIEASDEGERTYYVCRGEWKGRLVEVGADLALNRYVFRTYQNGDGSDL
jgi:hypothetical protein